MQPTVLTCRSFFASNKSASDSSHWICSLNTSPALEILEKQRDLMKNG